MKQEPVGVLAYRSQAVTQPSDVELERLLRVAQRRNHAEGLTGVLIYDRGAFFQWLEGPRSSLERVWNSISHDARHAEIQVLRDDSIPHRFFEGWDMRLGQGAEGSIDTAIAAMETPEDLLKHVRVGPISILNKTWDEVFATMVLPRLRKAHGQNVPYGSRLPTASIWHAEIDSGAQLARVLIAANPAGTARLVNSMLDQGASFNALCREVFEPAQRFLGQWWDEDRCDDFHLTIGLARLQAEVRRVNGLTPVAHALRPGHSVLLSLQPMEQHGVGLIMSSEVFGRGGWDVTCDFPNDDRALGELVHERWFDVLSLSLSGSLRRDHRLAPMRETIDAARAASLNPSLVVMVDGRTFIERPQAYRAVNANAGVASVIEALPLAERLLDAARSLTATLEVSAA